LTAWDSYLSGGKVALKSMAMGIEEEAVTDLISPPLNAHLYSTLGDVGGFRHDDLTKAPAAMYSIPYAGSYASIDYAELSPNFMVRVGFGDPSTSPPTKSSAFSFDGGASWFAGNNDISGLSSNGGTVAAAANASRVLWAPKNAQVSFSTDNGNSWTASSGIPQNSVVASDRVNPSKFYGYGQGKFWISTNAGVSFTSVTVTGMPQANDPVVLKAVPGHEGDIWLAGGSTGNAYGIWHSTDNGTTWTKISSATAATSIGFGMAAPGQSYMAVYATGTINGVQGIFRSDDAGTTWIQINDSAHQYASTCCITGDPRVYGRVYVGTNGLGIVYGDIAGTVSTPTPGTTPTPGVTPTPVRTPTPGITPTPVRTPTPGVTPTPIRTPTATSGTCSVHYAVVNQWQGGFGTNITITNTGTTAINGWHLQFVFPNGQTITQVWNATFTQSGSNVTLTDAGYNGTIAPGATVGSAPGFNGSWSGSNNSPTAFTLNGAACSVV
ncbi:MAG TPA: cellulose binding domain-containing protein, partial [Ktedonobacteraceae bacterium]|nr:cellulose binding domain-containing protein [Ktedonobacteraceae bacterium]